MVESPEVDDESSVNGKLVPELPSWVDESLWFVVKEYGCGERDYLEQRNPHTFPGRIAAYCPHQSQSYNFNLWDIDECSPETRNWVAGYLVGNEPGPPVAQIVFPDDHPNYGKWEKAAETYRQTGDWPRGAPNFSNPEGSEPYEDESDNPESGSDGPSYINVYLDGIIRPGS